MLVDYSSSSSDEENEIVNSRKRQRVDVNVKGASCPPRKEGCMVKKCDSETRITLEAVEDEVAAEMGKGNRCEALSRLPLPDRVLEMFQESEEEHTDDCSQHGGRLRSFQHERGNWATYVYFPYEPEDVFLELLDELKTVAATHGVPLTQADEFHVSISKTVVLRHHWIQPFVQSLRAGLAQCHSFVCLADKLKVYSNHEKTRTFLGMEISMGHSQLFEAVKRVNETMEEFRLSTFYKDPSFHVSLAWCVGDFADKLQDSCLPALQSLVDSHEDGRFQIKLNCKAFRCKTGNKVFLFPLHCP